MSLKLAFMGTPDFAVPSLVQCLEAGHEIRAVYTQPPRPAGRGMALQPSPVQRFAESRGLPVRTPKRLKDPSEHQAFAELGLDVAIVAAYGLILPKPILDAPCFGCINVHASLLPRWRGAAPIQRAIEAGDAETGITIMQMNEGLDTGDMLLVERMPISSDDTTDSLQKRLADLGARTLRSALHLLEQGKLKPQPQPEKGTTYAAKIAKEEMHIDWRRSAKEIDRKIRAFGAWTQASGARIKIRRAQEIEASGEPGVVIDDAPTIACGQASLRLLEVQREGRGPQDAASFLRGFDLPVGTRLS